MLITHCKAAIVYYAWSTRVVAALVGVAECSNHNVMYHATPDSVVYVACRQL